VEIVGMPIVREADGLAMSSRNSYLSAGERRQALALSDAIGLAGVAFRQGERSAAALMDLVARRLEQEPDARVDYVRICHDESLEDVAVVDRHAVLLLAVRIGRTRLIDNSYLVEEDC
jgi:pantoate--beta-alanine ligase